MSSVITVEPALASARTAPAMSSSEAPRLANASRAAGAMSWTSCAMPRPSSMSVAAPSESTCTFEVYPHGFFLPGRSPDLMSCLALVIELWPVSKESEMIPIFWP